MSVSTDPKQMARQATRLGLGASALYALLGTTWILASDAALDLFAKDAPWLTSAHSVKGIAFILVTTIGLAFIVRRSHLRRMRADAKAASHEKQTLGLFARHPQPMWVFDRASLAFLAVNDTAIERYGYTEREFLAMTLKDINPAEDAARVDERTSAPLTGPRVVGRVRHVKKSGEVIFAHVTVHPVEFDGRTATMAMAIDVTKEVLAAHALERQEAQFRQLHQSLGEVLWLADATDFRVIYVSPAFERVYGRPCSELLANTPLWMDAVLPEDRVHAAASNNQLRTLGHSRCEYRIRRPDGSIRWISDRKNVIRDSEGLVTLIGGIAEDITAQVELDAERASQKIRLEHLVAERTAELETVNIELEAFTRSAAHDLKSPLSGIAGYCHLLSRRHGRDLGDAGLGMVEKIERSARDMSTLVNDLLMLSRVAATELAVQHVDLAQVAREVIDELMDREPGRKVVLDVPAELQVWLDPGLSRSLLANLLGNCWKFTSTLPVAHIEVTAERSGGSTVVVIKDNGVGFDSTIAPRLFKPFQRFHALSEFHGTGVGLVTCQRIVHRHGGELQIASSPGAGTTVKFTVPQLSAALSAGSTAGKS